MAILVISNELLRDPEIWDMIDDYADTIEIVKKETCGTVMRIQNSQLPKEDYLVDLTVYRFTDVRPFVLSFRVHNLYKA